MARDVIKGRKGNLARICRPCSRGLPARFARWGSGRAIGFRCWGPQSDAVDIIYFGLWLGAVAVPVNTRWSAAEILYSLDDSIASVCFSMTAS